MQLHFINMIYFVVIIVINVRNEIIIKSSVWEFTFRESQLNVQIKMLTTTSYFYLLNIRGDIIQH